MATIDEIQGAIRLANDKVKEASQLATEAAFRVREAKRIITGITTETGMSSLLQSYQVSLTDMIEATDTIVNNAGIATDAGERFSSILSA
jgi:hypothetical protein